MHNMKGENMTALASKFDCQQVGVLGAEYVYNP